MEVFTGDRQVPKPDDFPLHISPFPEPTATDLLYAHPTAMIHSASSITHRPISPPQKLRPIRFNVRSPVSDFPENGGLLETLEKGLLSDEAVCDMDRELEYCAVKVEAGEAPKSAGCGNGTASVIVSDPVQFGSGTVEEGGDPNGGEHVVDDRSSSTSDDSDDHSTSIFEGRRKRRRQSRRKLELFLENLVTEVMEKQEQMHKQLIEMIEKKEKERLTREEAWKQQEMERMKRDEEARAQETSRNLALISFIQNTLGHEIQIPQVQPVVYRSMELDSGAETNSQKNVKCDSNSKRWPEDEVQALITLRTALEHKFRITGSKGSIWEEISVGMCNMGYNRTAKKCKEKWENLNKYFRRSMMRSGKNRSANSKTRPYFHDLELLYNNSLINPENGFSITKDENEAKGENDLSHF